MFALFNATSRCVSTAGMDGVPIGRDLRQVEAAARAYGIEWDQELLTRFQTLEGFWLEAEYERIEQERLKAKTKK